MLPLAKTLNYLMPKRRDHPSSCPVYFFLNMEANQEKGFQVYCSFNCPVTLSWPASRAPQRTEKQGPEHTKDAKKARSSDITKFQCKPQCLFVTTLNIRVVQTHNTHSLLMLGRDLILSANRTWVRRWASHSQPSAHPSSGLGMR